MRDRSLVVCFAVLTAAAAGCGDDDRQTPPVLQDVMVTTAAGTPVEVSVPLTAVDASAVTLGVVTAPSHGALTGAGPTWTYTPAADYAGSDSAVVIAADAHGRATATLTIVVTAVEHAPVAVADAVVVAEGSAATAIDVLANDRDAGSRTVASVGQPGHGTAAVAADGRSVTYTPADGYCNQAPNTPHDTFTYTLAPGGSTAAVDVAVTCACGLHRPTDFVVGSN